MDNKGIVTSFFRYIIFYIAVAMMGALILLFPAVANNSAIYYETIIAAFLGVDIAITLKATNALPEGQFKLIKKARYITAFISNIVLFVLASIIGDRMNLDMTPCVTVFVSGCFLILTMFIGAIEGNKLLARSDPTPEKKEEFPDQPVV